MNKRPIFNLCSWCCSRQTSPELPKRELWNRLEHITENDWPFVRHRGGPSGFGRVLAPQQIGFAEYGGNRQMIGVGSISKQDGVALFMMDYIGNCPKFIIPRNTAAEIKRAASLFRGRIAKLAAGLKTR